jgi:hypothetical protein
MNAVDSIIEKWDDDLVRTHSADCWQWHPTCAIALLADEIYYLRSLIEAWADADDVYTEGLTNAQHDALEAAYDILRAEAGR